VCCTLRLEISAKTTRSLVNFVGIKFNPAGRYNTTLASMAFSVCRLEVFLDWQAVNSTHTIALAVVRLPAIDAATDERYSESNQTRTRWINGFEGIHTTRPG
jgi:hypothetical protein